MTAGAAGPPDTAAVVWEIDRSAVERAQGYRLEISPRGVVVRARDLPGAFYGACTLVQLVRDAVPRLRNASEGSAKGPPEREELLAAVATNGGGSYYYLEHPGEMARVLDDELGRASRVCAAEVEIVIRLRPGWIFRDVAGYEWRREGDDVIVRLGDLSAGARRTLLTRMRIDGGKPGRREAADVRIRYRDPESGKILKEDPRKVELELVEDRQVYEKNYVPEVRERRAVIESNEAMRDASRLVDKGEKGKALGLLKKQEAALAAAAPCPSVQAEQKANQEYRDEIEKMETMPPGEASAVQKRTKYRSYQELFQK